MFPFLRFLLFVAPVTFSCISLSLRTPSVMSLKPSRKGAATSKQLPLHKRVASRPEPAIEIEEEVEVEVVAGEDKDLLREVCNQWPALKKLKIMGVEYVRYDAIAQKGGIASGSRSTTNKWIWDDKHCERVIKVEKRVAITMVLC